MRTELLGELKINSGETKDTDMYPVRNRSQTVVLVDVGVQWHPLEAGSGSCVSGLGTEQDTQNCSRSSCGLLRVNTLSRGKVKCKCISNDDIVRRIRAFISHSMCVCGLLLLLV